MISSQNSISLSHVQNESVSSLGSCGQKACDVESLNLASPVSGFLLLEKRMDLFARVGVEGD